MHLYCGLKSITWRGSGVHENHLTRSISSGDCVPHTGERVHMDPVTYVTHAQYYAQYLNAAESLPKCAPGKPPDLCPFKKMSLSLEGGGYCGDKSAAGD